MAKEVSPKSDAFVPERDAKTLEELRSQFSSRGRSWKEHPIPDRLIEDVWQELQSAARYSAYTAPKSPSHSQGQASFFPVRLINDGQEYVLSVATDDKGIRLLNASAECFDAALKAIAATEAQKTKGEFDYLPSFKVRPVTQGPSKYER